MFDRNWRFDRTLLVDGSAVERAKAHQIVRPKPAGSVPSVELDRYVGKYRLPNGLIARIERDGTRLFAITDERQELRAQTETGFYLPTYGMWIEFVSDAAGKVKSFTGAGRGDFEAPRVD
jgi:hypothetical protein